jgi:hypothetical protein
VVPRPSDSPRMRGALSIQPLVPWSSQDVPLLKTCTPCRGHGWSPGSTGHIHCVSPPSFRSTIGRDGCPLSASKGTPPPGCRPTSLDRLGSGTLLGGPRFSSLATWLRTRHLRSVIGGGTRHAPTRGSCKGNLVEALSEDSNSQRS